MSDLKLVEEDLRFKFYYNGQFCLAYNKGYKDLGDFYLNGLYQIGRALTVSSTPAALEKSLDHYEWAIAKHPDKYGSIYTNAGLSARDLGVATGRSSA